MSFLYNSNDNSPMIKQETWLLSLLLLFYLLSSWVPNKSSGIVQLMFIETSVPV